MTEQVPSPSVKKIAILLPVRNEDLNLQIMIRILDSFLEVSHEIIVIVDDEEDTSVALVRDMQSQFPHLQLAINTLGRGIPNAIKTGCLAANSEYILIFAADELGPILAINNMLQLAEQGCEFVSCTRYAYGGRRFGGSRIGKLLSGIANRTFNWISGCAFTDATTGIKLFRKDVFEKLNLESNPVGWAVAFEMSIKAQLLGLKLGEVPITSIDRLYGGESTFQLGSWTQEYLRWYRWGLIALWQSPHRNTKVMRVDTKPEGMGYISLGG